MARVLTDEARKAMQAGGRAGAERRWRKGQPGADQARRAEAELALAQAEQARRHADELAAEAQRLAAEAAATTGAAGA